MVWLHSLRFVNRRTIVFSASSQVQKLEILFIGWLCLWVFIKDVRFSNLTVNLGQSSAYFTKYRKYVMFSSSFMQVQLAWYNLCVNIQAFHQPVNDYSTLRFHSRSRYCTPKPGRVNCTFTRKRKIQSNVKAINGNWNTTTNIFRSLIQGFTYSIWVGS